MLTREVPIQMPECPRIEEQTASYLLRSFNNAERRSFKILNRLDCLTELVRHLDTPREVSSAGFRSLNLGLDPFCVRRTMQ